MVWGLGPQAPGSRPNTLQQTWLVPIASRVTSITTGPCFPGVVVVLANVEPPEKPPPSTSLKDAVEALLCRYLEDADKGRRGPQRGKRLGQHMASPYISIPGIQTWRARSGKQRIVPQPRSNGGGRGVSRARGSRFSRLTASPALPGDFSERRKTQAQFGGPGPKPLEAPAPSP